MNKLRIVCRSASMFLSIVLLSALSASAQQKKPNILILWGDDIGYWNVSAYNQGMMGYKTPASAGISSVPTPIAVTPEIIKLSAVC